MQLYGIGCFCFKQVFKMTCALFDAFQFDLDAIMPMRMAPPATALYSNVEKDSERERKNTETDAHT